MEITVGEAADALSVSLDSIVRWYTQDRNAKAPHYFGLDTEVLCENINLDHRFLMAFLVGYDIALRNREVQVLLGKNRHWAPDNLVPVLVVPSASLRKTPLVRYSYRRVVPHLLKHLEESNVVGGKQRRSSRPRGGTICDAPDHLPHHQFQFRSALVTEGERLPWSRRTRLAHGGESSLRIPDGRGGEEG